MDWIDSLDTLEAVYGTTAAASTRKVAHQMTPQYREWINASRFCVLSTVGPEGTDGSPRGDDGAVVRELDPGTLALPDWHGNNRIDSLRNIVRDERVSLMFMVPGQNNVIRINGKARLTTDETLRASFEFKGKQPRSVIVIRIGEIYFQCARALIRSRLWEVPETPAALPTPGQILATLTEGEVGGDTYDREWPERAAQTMW